MSPVRATLTGTWPGADASQAAAAVVQELGAPHLPVIPELPARGPGSDPTGRTAVMLDELAVDLQPHGWRLTDTPGVDARRGASTWRADLNRLADAVGETGGGLEEIVLRIVGPLTLAARLWLPGGERALSDSGARRDVADSLASGLAEQVRVVQSVTGAHRVTVVLAEPDAGQVLSGQVPTASGYRTVRSVPRVEARRAWSTVATAVAQSGAQNGAGVMFAPGLAQGDDDSGPSWTDLALLVSESLPPASVVAVEGPVAGGAVGEVTATEPTGSDTAPPLRGLVLPVPRLEGPGADPARWEVIAGWVEAGRTVVLGLDRPSSGTAAYAAVEATVRALLKDWERMGLDEELLGQLVLRGPGLADTTPDRALEVTRAVVRGAETLERMRVDGELAR
ncbi:hypothetical protein [Micrococcus terreus]|uniref:hypothetical protein n=1 Tax=Micrococcus terreus TaxID=574650 RepID=UPI0023F9226D|nr:hypothetical protein [Micrococcus terreus]